VVGKGRRRRLKPIRLWREVPILLVIALLLSLGIKTFAVQAFSIPSQSMEDTILPGDRVLVDKFSPWFGSQPQRGDIVVFQDPGGWLPPQAPSRENIVVRYIRDVFTFVGLLPAGTDRYLIKRVIGVPGDTVACCNAQGKITVNGLVLNESNYLFPNAAPSQMRFDVKVPAGHIWVMGDNRGDSADSRFHMNNGSDGTVPISDVVGHAFVLIWPPSRVGGLSVPATFHQKGLAAVSELPGASDAPAAAALVGALPVRLAGGRLVRSRRLRRRWRWRRRFKRRRGTGPDRLSEQ
jgi:signal peptidase I